jgi:hypothetical protein
MAPGPIAPSEMLSGPDLGGGYLHQLSIDRLGEATTFTHHAQEGGDDAGGPPIGDLAPLGFVHPPAPCMFGGPRCWHRRFLLPFAAAPRVRTAYQRHRFVLETILRQVHQGAPVAVDTALRDVVGRLAGPLAAEGIPWYVAGSTSVRLLGGAVRPNDLDLGTVREGVERIGALLRDYLIEPVAPTDRPDGRLVLGGRAFVGRPGDGARVEWAVPLEPGPAPPLEEFAPQASVTRTVEVPFEGGTLRVSRPEYALLRAASRRSAPAVDAALLAIGRLGVDVELLDTLLGRSSLAPAERTELRGRAVTPSG